MIRPAHHGVEVWLWDEASIGIASHQVDGFILEPVTDRYLGRLCDFNACPKGKTECRVPGCGNVALLRQHEGFRWRAEGLTEGRAIDRSAVPRERSTTSRGRCWVTGRRTEWGFGTHCRISGAGAAGRI